MKNIETNQVVRIVRRNIKKYIVGPSLIRRYLREQSALRKLNLGAGNNPIKGWFNIDLRPRRWDIAYMDVRKEFPFPEKSFNYILGEHLIEHLTLEEGKFMLQECFRTLRNGGKLRLSTPDLKFITNLYSPTAENEEYIRSITKRFLPDLAGRSDYRPLFVINNAFYNFEHKFLYDEGLLKESFEYAGFNNIQRVIYGQSEDPNLLNIEMHSKGVGIKGISEIESLVLEGTK